MFSYFSETESSEQADTATIKDFEYSLTRIADSFDDLLRSKCMSEAEALQTFDALKDAPRPPIPDEPLDRSPVPEATPDSDTPTVLHYKAMSYDLRPVPFRAASKNDAIPIAGEWTPLAADWNPHAYFEDFDLLEAGKSVALRPGALPLIGDLFCRYGELLEFTTPTGPIHYFRCLNIVDALSPKTKVQTTDSGVYISDPAFDTKKVAGAGIFTLPQQPDRATLYFHKDVAAEIGRSGIRHRKFLPLWQAYEAVPPKEQPT